MVGNQQTDQSERNIQEQNKGKRENKLIKTKNKLKGKNKTNKKQW